MKTNIQYPMINNQKNNPLEHIFKIQDSRLKIKKNYGNQDFRDRLPKVPDT